MIRFADGAQFTLCYTRREIASRTGDLVDASIDVAPSWRRASACRRRIARRSDGGGCAAGRARSDGRHGDADRGSRIRRAGLGRHDRRRDDPQRPAARQPVGDARSRAGHRRPQPAELRAGPADQLARLRRALDVRRARRAAVPGRHSGHDAGRPGPDRQLQPALRAAHRSAARTVLGALRQRVRRRHCRVHRGRRRSAASRSRRLGRQLRHVDRGPQVFGQRRRRPLRRRREPVRHRRLSRAFGSGSRSRERESEVRSRGRHADHADRLAADAARHAGSPRTDARPVASRSAPGRPGRAAVQYAQDDSSAAGRGDDRADRQQRDDAPRDALRRPSQRSPVPRAVGRRRDVVGWCHGPRSKLRRRRRARRMARDACADGR